jgi:hypothetical protein
MSEGRAILSFPTNRKSASAGAAFDRIAKDCDLIFTSSPIGRAQQNAVWKILTQTFSPSDKILELNCLCFEKVSK